MKRSIAVQGIAGAVLVMVVLGSSGCATRRFVRNRVSETEAKTTARINEGEKNTADKISALDEKHQTDTSRLNEVAKGADQRAGQAIQDAARANTKAEDAGQRASESAAKADQAGAKADQAQNMAKAAESRVDSLGTLKMVASESVLFSFGSSTLKKDEMEKLDAIAQTATSKFHTIEVHGFTDPVGDKSYNLSLSKQRAEAVARYLAQKHNVPLHRIQLMGFGSNPIDDQDVKGRERNRLSRRVEVRIFAPSDAPVQASSL
jgi:outer membrane protein OmpA-like peptidoglycan-associated protein